MSINSKRLVNFKGAICLVIFFYSGWVLGGLLIEPMPKYPEIFSETNTEVIP